MTQYPNDVDPILADELMHFHAYLQQAHPDKNHNFQDMYNVVIKDNIQSAFPNIEITLRLFLTLMVTNCSGERSFSRLKRIKNEARSTMSQERLSDLSILSIESDKLRTLTFADIIDDFAAKRTRKKLLQLLLLIFLVRFSNATTAATALVAATTIIATTQQQQRQHKQQYMYMYLTTTATTLPAAENMVQSRTLCVKPYLSFLHIL